MKSLLTDVIYTFAESKEVQTTKSERSKLDDVFPPYLDQALKDIITSNGLYLDNSDSIYIIV